MADEIRQELGFDASEALAVLGQLNAAFARFSNALQGAGNRIGAFNATAAKLDERLLSQKNMVQQVARVYEQTRTPLEQHNSRMSQYSALLKSGAMDQDLFNRAAARSKETLDAATKSTTAYVISWQTLSRVLMTQAIVRGLNAVRDAFEFAIQSQIKFSKAVSEVRAIDTRSFAEIATDVREMADAFNQPISTVAEAQYQVLSNQFTTAADRLNILSAANKLAKTTEDDLVGSVQLLTGALNAYGESSEMAELRAAQMFKTIQLGRLRASELGTALGRVQSVAQQLGVAVEELDAAMITLTIGGVKATEASTQLRGMLTAMLKPSEAMKKALHDLNVESGEAAIRTWGFAGAWEKVRSVTDGSSAAMGKLAPNVRGVAGALRVLNEGADEYAEALESLRSTDLGEFSARAAEALSTDAARLTAEVNKLKNFFTTELGADAVSALNRIITLLGGANGLVGVLRVVTKETPLVAAAIGGVILALNRLNATAATTAAKVGFAAATGATGFARFQAAVASSTKSLATLRGALGLLAVWEVGRILGNQIGDLIRESVTRSAKEAQAEFDKTLDHISRSTQAQTRTAILANEERLRSLRQLVAANAGEYFRDQENLKQVLAVQVESSKRAFAQILQARRKLTQDLYKAADDAYKRQTNALDQAAAIRRDIEDSEFNNQVDRFNRADLAYARYRDRFNEMANRAARLTAAVKDADEQKAADEAWRRADAYKQLMVSSARQVGNAVVQRQAQEAIVSAAERHERSLKRQSQLQGEIAQKLETQARQSQANDENLRKAADLIEKKQSQWIEGQEGNLILKDPDQAKRDLAEASTMIDQWVEAVKRTTKGDFLKNFLGDAQALKSVQRDAERLLASQYIKDVRIAPEAMARMWDDLQASADKLRLEVPVIAKIEEITGKNILQDGMNELFNSLGETLSTSITRAFKEAALDQRTQAATDLFTKSQAQLKNLTPPTEGGVLGGKSEWEQATRRIDLVFDALRKGAPLTKGFRSDLQKSVDALRDVKGGSNAAAAAVANVWKAMDQLNQINTEREALPDAMGKAQLDAIIQQIDATNQKAAAESAAAAQAEREQGATQEAANAAFNHLGAVQSSIGPVNALASAWANVAAQARAAAAAAASAGGAQTAALGGIIHRAAGGFTPRGIDTVPAMLSPGEFVVNAQSTKRFYSQLVAMNAGVAPAYRAQGGSATTITVGDIHVNGAAQPRDTAREVIQSIKRELRRGTSKW